MKTVAILYICTGKYITFWEKFYSSMKEHFLLNSDVHYFVFTDAKELTAGQNNKNVHRIYQEDLGWPNNTLHRFKMFKRIEEQLQEFDYIYFFNANYVCLKDIDEEAFLPKGNQLVVTLHPGYFNSKSRNLTYDRNPKSSAYISYFSLRSRYYFCGGLNGGSSKKYLKLINDLAKQIEIDDQNGVVALWHDESHLNKYMLKQRNYKILSPSYAYPEDWNIPFEPILLLLTKNKFFPIEKARYGDRNNQIRLNKHQQSLVNILDRIKYNHNK